MLKPPCLEVAEPQIRWGSEWGGGDVSLTEKTNASLKLKYCLQAIGHRSGTLLEVGCGQGKFLRAIHNYGKHKWHCFGCDIDVHNLRKTSLESEKNRDICFSGADISTLPFKDSSFDVIVLFDVLEHVELVEAGIQEFYRIMRPGAILHTFIPCEGNIWTLHGLLFKLGIARNLKKDLAGHIHQFVTNEIVDRFLVHGFTVERVRYSGYFFEQLFDLLFYVGLKFPLLHSVLAMAHTGSLEGARKEDSRLRMAAISFFQWLKNVVFGISHYESLLLAKSPYSLGLHATFRKIEGNPL